MSGTPKTPEEILCIEECVKHIRSEYTTLYPSNKKTNRTLGNVPDLLHKKIIAFSKEHNLRVAQTIASLWDFYCEYELDFEAQLKIQRRAPKRRRA